jgi:hypothetical protein
VGVYGASLTNLTDLKPALPIEYLESVLHPSSRRTCQVSEGLLGYHHGVVFAHSSSEQMHDMRG